MKKKKLKFEKFSKLSDVEKMGIAFFVGLFVMLGCITIYKTFAVYKEETTFDVIEGIVPDFKKKDKDLEIAIMVDGETRDEAPTEEYYYVTVECEKDEADTISGEWDYTNKRVNMSGYITKPAVCTINFNSVFESIIVDGEEKDRIPDKGDYQVQTLTCENVTSSEWDNTIEKPRITGVKENSSCNINLRSTKSIIKIIGTDGSVVESYPSKKDAPLGAKITCTNEATGEWDKENWKPIIKDIINETTCDIDFSTIDLSNNAQVGDYIAYTPNKKSYMISGDLTGCPGKGTIVCPTTDQTINPNELNLWRVIKVNEDNTIEVVSEYVSSTKVYFEGEKGYPKYVGTLNKIASAYETEGITINSHHIGYDGEKDDCGEVKPLSGACGDEKGSESAEFNEAELLISAIGTLKSYTPDGKSSGYYLASRAFSAYNYMRRVDENGRISAWLVMGYPYDDYSRSADSIRPIVTLKSGLSATESEKDGKKLWTIEQ